MRQWRSGFPAGFHIPRLRKWRCCWCFVAFVAVPLAYHNWLLLSFLLAKFSNMLYLYLNYSCPRHTHTYCVCVGVCCTLCVCTLCLYTMVLFFCVLVSVIIGVGVQVGVCVTVYMCVCAWAISVAAIRHVLLEQRNGWLCVSWHLFLKKMSSPYHGYEALTTSFS